MSPRPEFGPGENLTEQERQKISVIRRSSRKKAVDRYYHNRGSLAVIAGIDSLDSLIAKNCDKVWEVVQDQGFIFRAHPVSAEEQASRSLDADRTYLMLRVSSPDGVKQAELTVWSPSAGYDSDLEEELPRNRRSVDLSVLDPGYIERRMRNHCCRSATQMMDGMRQVTLSILRQFYPLGAGAGDNEEESRVKTTVLTTAQASQVNGYSRK